MDANGAAGWRACMFCYWQLCHSRHDPPKRGSARRSCCGIGFRTCRAGRSKPQGYGESLQSSDREDQNRASGCICKSQNVLHMSYNIICRVKPYIQPFERRLALQELTALAGAQPCPLPSLVDEADRFQVRSRVPAPDLARELAFWEVVAADKTFMTRQSLRESTANIVR